MGACAWTAMLCSVCHPDAANKVQLEWNKYVKSYAATCGRGADGDVAI
jgi:hypothetical protein